MIEFFYIYCLNKLISKVDNDDKRNVGREDPLFFLVLYLFHIGKDINRGFFLWYNIKA